MRRLAAAGVAFFVRCAPAGTVVVFGGFDSYIEEFFPILASLRNRGWNVIGFEGPGQAPCSKSSALR